jgi:hypothetical protein
MGDCVYQQCSGVRCQDSAITGHLSKIPSKAKRKRGNPTPDTYEQI